MLRNERSVGRVIGAGILMQPKADGYAERVTPKKLDPAVLADGGAGNCQKSCGGRR